MLDRSERGIATKLRIRNARDDARAPGVGKTVYRIASPDGSTCLRGAGRDARSSSDALAIADDGRVS